MVPTVMSWVEAPRRWGQEGREAALHHEAPAHPQVTAKAPLPRFQSSEVPLPVVPFLPLVLLQPSATLIKGPETRGQGLPTSAWKPLRGAEEGAAWDPTQDPWAPHIQSCHLPRPL